MKLKNKVFSILAVSIIASFTFISCDKVEEGDYLKPVGKKPSLRVVFLEDYTGHTCPNCAEAAEVAEAIEKLYPDNVVVISVHAAKGFVNTSAAFPEDFTTPEGTFWNEQFKISGYPAGMINRVKRNNTYRVGAANWLSAVNTELGKEPEVLITLTCNYNSVTKDVSIQATVTFQKDVDKDLRIGGMLLQDSIVGPQKDSRISPSQVNPNFVFMNVLRQTFGGNWGDRFVAKEGGYKKGETKTYNFSFNLPEDYNNTACIPENCHFVVYVATDEPAVMGDDYQILQAAKINIVQ